MFDRLRDRIAALAIRAERFTREWRHPGAQRVANAMRTLAGVTITPDTAVTIATVWACLRFLSQTTAMCSWRAMRDGKNGPEVSPSHGVDYLVWKRVSDEWSSFQFRETLVHWALRWGNGYAEIERDQADRPFALWPIHPERVVVCRATEDGTSDAGRPIPTGKLFYEVANGTGGKSIVAAQDMYHLRGFGEGPVGVNVIAYASQSLGWARAIQLFGASFFGNGMNVGGVVVNKKPLSPAGLKRQRAELEQLYKGPNNANRFAVIDNDADWKSVGIDPQKSQLVEVHQHLVEEVCRWFGVPPHKVMHLLRATFSNIEQQAIEVVVDAIAPWAKRLEDEADFKLFGVQNRLGFYTKIDLRDLMRGDTAARAAYYREMVAVGAFSPNMVLQKEGERTIGTAGDIHVMQSQNVTLETIAEGPADNVVPLKPGKVPTEPPASDPAEQRAAAELIAWAEQIERVAA
jgi:HK97 family phage portal protein